jgi:hypothetical protein
MPALILPSRWAQQPQGPVQVDWAHPLARGLVYFAVGNEANAPDLVSGSPALPISTTSRIATGAGGRGFNSPSSASTTGWYHPLSATAKTIATAYTIAVHADVRTSAVTTKYLSIPYRFNTFTAPFSTLALVRSSTGSRIGVFVAQNTTSNTTFAPADGAVALTGRSTLAASANGTAAAFYQNGVPLPIDVNSLTSGPVLFSTGDTVSLLNRSAKSPGESVNGMLYWAGLWNRTLSDAEHRELHRAPYQFLRPVSARSFSFAALALSSARSGAAAASCPRPSAAGAAARTGVPNRSAAKPAGTLVLARTGQMAGATGYWAFQETSGAAVNLAAPGTGNATIQSAAARATDALGAYLSCAKNINSYAATGLSGTALGAGGGATRTVFCRFRASSQAYANDATLGTYTGGLFHYGGSGAGSFLSFRQASPTNPPSDLWLANTGTTPQNAEIAITPTVNTVHTAVLTYDGTTLRTYVDGTLRQQFVAALNTLDTAAFDIGRMAIAADRWNFQGRIYEVGVVPGVAWDASQVAAYDADPVLRLSGSGTGDEFTSEFTSEFGTLGATGRVATGAATVPKATAAATGSRTIPARTATGAATAPKATATAAAARTVPARTGTGSATAPMGSTASAATRTIPARTAASSAAAPPARASATGLRGVPGTVGSVQSILPRGSTAATAARAVPTRTASSGATVPMASTASAATRTIPARTAASPATVPKATTSTLGARSAPPSQGYAAEVLADAPRLFWRFDTTTGTVPDASGNGFTATTSGLTTANRSAAGPLSGQPTASTAFEFVGDGDYVTSTSATATALGIDGTKAKTIECWVRADGLGSTYVGAWEIGSKSGGQYMALCHTDSATAYSVNTYGPNATWTGPGHGVWQLVHVTYDPTDATTPLKAYVNASQVLASATTVNLGTANPLLAGYLDFRPWVGLVAELAVYDKVLSTGRMAAHLAAAAGAAPTNTTGVAASAVPAAQADATALRTIPARTATGAATLPKASAAATATRAAPARTGAASAAVPVPTTASAALRTIPPVTGTSPSAVPRAATSATASRSAPGISGASQGTVPAAASAATALRTIPARTGSSPSTLPRPSAAATGSRTSPGIAGTSQGTVPRAGATAAAARTIPPRTAAAAAAVPAARSAATALRAHPARTGSSPSTLPRPSAAATGFAALPGTSGPSSATVPKARAEASAARTIPDRSGAGSNVVPFARSSAAATRRPVPVTAASAAAVPPARASATGTATTPQFQGTSTATVPRTAVASVGSAARPQFTVLSAARLPPCRTALAGRAISPHAADVSGVVWLTGTVAYDIELQGEVKVA